MTVAVLYEHPEWFQPLFAALERRGVDHVPLDATTVSWDPGTRPPYSLIINRLSPSAYLRGHGHVVHAGLYYLVHAEACGIPVINGANAYRLEISKAAQLDLLESLGLSYPRSRVISHPRHAATAALGLRFPVVVKPNIGGSGARIQRFDSEVALARAAAEGAIDLGIDEVGIVQEFLPARGGSITRIELLAGRFLYAIRITPPSSHGFNLCPADICRDEVTQVEGACPIKPAMQIEATSVTDEVLEGAQAIAAAAGLDICGIEYLIDDRDGLAYFYDINALSNFVTDAPRVVGFDPFERFVDYIELRLRPKHVAQAFRACEKITLTAERAEFAEKNS